MDHIITFPSVPAAQLLPVSILFYFPVIYLLNIICRLLPPPLLLFLLLLDPDLALLLALSLFPSLPLPLFLPPLLNGHRF